MAAGAAELKLLGFWPSPFMHRVQVALQLKGMTGYKYAEEDLMNKSELLVSSNPAHKKVPVLLHAGKPVCESMLMVQYLDDAFPAAGPSFLPADPHARALARFWASYVDFFGSWIKAIVATTDEDQATALETMEGVFEECSKGKAFFGGNGPIVAGIAGRSRVPRPGVGQSKSRSGSTNATRAVVPDVGRLAEFASRDMLPLLRHLLGKAGK